MEEPLKPRAALAFMEVLDIVAASFGENGKRCYKVKWKDSWVYHDHLFDCKELIDLFWSQQPEKNSEEKVGTNTNQETKRSNCTDKGQTKSGVTVVVMNENSGTTHSDNENLEDDTEMEEEWDLGDTEGDATHDADWKNENNRSKDKRKFSSASTFSQLNVNQIVRVRKKEIYSCHICKHEFDLVSAIRRHYRESHPSSKPFACEICDRRFDRKENLSRHIRIHTGDRKYVCNHCGKGYTDPSGLRKHVLSRHTEPPFLCEICHAKFKSKGAFNRHIGHHLSAMESKKNDLSNSKLHYLRKFIDTNVAFESNELDNSSQSEDITANVQSFGASNTIGVHYLQITETPPVVIQTGKVEEKSDSSAEVTESNQQDSFVIQIPAQSLLTLDNQPLRDQSLVSPETKLITVTNGCLQYSSENA